jgi:cold shock CspA family protein
VSATVDEAVAGGPHAASAGAFEQHTGTVTAFDEFAGWGTVTDAAGTERFFHCTTIADGTRTIAVGTDVSFEVRPGAAGSWEATRLTPR